MLGPLQGARWPKLRCHTRAVIHTNTTASTCIRPGLSADRLIVLVGAFVAIADKCRRAITGRTAARTPYSYGPFDWTRVA